MANVREKGKIPRDEWPKILARYNGGETIAEIGRAYGCTAPAIRYIIKRSGMLPDQSVSGREVQPATVPETSLNRESPPVLRDIATSRGKDVFGPELRTRVAGDIAAFLVALDQAEVDTSAEVISTLQEASERLMRSTARVRLELERLLGDRQPVTTRPRSPAAPRQRL